MSDNYDIGEISGILRAAAYGLDALRDYGGQHHPLIESDIEIRSRFIAVMDALSALDDAVQERGPYARGKP